MVDFSNKPLKGGYKIVGSYIRRKREALKISQRALGQLFSPVVTTQFISNVERGVTPLPPNHVETLASALKIPKEELKLLLEKEYALKLSTKLGSSINLDADQPSQAQIKVSPQDYEFMSQFYNAYQLADEKSRNALLAVCDSILNIQKPPQSSE